MMKARGSFRALSFKRSTRGFSSTKITSFGILDKINFMQTPKTKDAITSLWTGQPVLPSHKHLLKDDEGE
ncbi:hypothetical protein AYI69_g4002 [Smittium culicis]|uniref:Uncharacterized protein n=1 Tax=Smittium culicis TaxID=133412 RepID=A0A1R1YI41_9FUNG|nr:hypothetical protein AYI69_g4002 [Smittium culicis]